MLGIVLAAGGGTRLRPLTDDLPKTLLGVDGDRSVYELALANLAEAGIQEVMVVTGHAAERIREVNPALANRYGLTVREVFNDKFAEWNNAYSLWLAREAFENDTVLLVNGDTVHPASVEKSLLAARGTAPIVLALDDNKVLAEEEMKVELDAEGNLARINKGLDPTAADGEYIGVTLIEPTAGKDLSDALEATFTRDPGLYYEDGYQEFADRGGIVKTASIGPVDWIEVDNHDDLARAREIACHY